LFKELIGIIINKIIPITYISFDHIPFIFSLILLCINKYDLGPRLPKSRPRYLHRYRSLGTTKKWYYHCSLSWSGRVNFHFARTNFRFKADVSALLKQTSSKWLNFVEIGELSGLIYKTFKLALSNNKSHHPSDRYFLSHSV